LYLKTYLGQGNGAISFNLKEERGNQQPQQQKHSAGFSEHGYFLNFILKFNDLISSKPVRTTAPGIKTIRAEGDKASLFIYWTLDTIK